MNEQIPRRTALRGIGLAATAGVLAGCSSDAGDGESDGGDGGGYGGGGDGDSDGGGGEDTSVPSEVDDYLSGAMEYEGEAVDATGEDSPTVDVGAGNAGLAFDPPALRVSTGTTVTWVWTGQGGGHNVVAEDGAFDSGGAVVEEGTEFQHTFEDSGNYHYYCNPHRASGMLGAVIVE
jgi:halocyanin-like protein